jgi:hypothetical protein
MALFDDPDYWRFQGYAEDAARGTHRQFVADLDAAIRYRDEMAKTTKYRGHFRPQDEKEHARGNRGEDVPDYCAGCERPFMEHSNGECPEVEDDE